MKTKKLGKNLYCIGNVILTRYLIRLFRNNLIIIIYINLVENDLRRDLVMGFRKYFDAFSEDYTCFSEEQIDKKFVSQLIKYEDSAWLYLIDACEGLLARHKKHLEDFSLTLHDLFNETVIYLIENDCFRLRKFLETGSSFIAFMYNQFRAVKKALLYKFSRDRDYGMSDEVSLDTLIKQIGQNQEDRLWRMSIREIVNQAFSLLWESNTQKANVYLMREKLQMPSKHVAAFLGLTVANVDATFKRTKNELKDILREMGYDYGKLFC